MNDTEQILHWRFYYSDGSTFDNLQGSKEDAPPMNVICVKQTSPMHGWVVTAFKDFYYWADNEWYGADQVGFWMYMFKPGAKIVKFGVSVPHEQFNAIMSRAINDAGFGEKSAKAPLEFGNEKGWTSEK